MLAARCVCLPVGWIGRPRRFFSHPLHNAPGPGRHERGAHSNAEVDRCMVLRSGGLCLGHDSRFRLEMGSVALAIKEHALQVTRFPIG